VCTIPANEEYGSLNIAAAIQILCYEWHDIAKIDFLDKQNPTPVMRKLRRLFDRSELTSAEINILRGILKNVIKQ